MRQITKWKFIMGCGFLALNLACSAQTREPFMGSEIVKLVEARCAEKLADNTEDIAYEILVKYEYFAGGHGVAAKFMVGTGVTWIFSAADRGTEIHESKLGVAHGLFPTTQMLVEYCDFWNLPEKDGVHQIMDEGFFEISITAPRPPDDDPAKEYVRKTKVVRRVSPYEWNRRVGGTFEELIEGKKIEKRERSAKEERLIVLLTYLMASAGKADYLCTDFK